MNAVNSMRMSGYISKYTKEEYLSLHQAKYNGHMLTSESLNKILQNQKNIYTKRFNKLNNSKMSFKEINALMEEWTSKNGMIGEHINDVMQNLLLFNENGQTSKVSTSGGVKVGDATLSTARSTFNTSKKAALASIQEVCNGVDQAINTMINTLADCHEDLLVQQALSAYYENNQNIPSELSQRIPKDAVINSALVDKSNNKIPKLMQTIKEEKAKLQQLGKSEKKYNAKNFKENYSEIIGALIAAFNGLGGIILETADSYAFNEAYQQLSDITQAKNQELAKKLAAEGHNWYVTATGQERDERSGAETKNDISIVWTKNGISFIFGGTIKLRQGMDFRGQGGKGSEALAVKGFVARSENLGSLLKKVNRYSPGIKEYAQSSLAALNDESPFASWEILKQCVGALTLVDAISGLGGAGDFSTLLIVNNRIFSVGDILNKAYDSQEALLTKAARKPYLVEGMSLHSLRRQLTKTMNEQAKAKPHQTAAYTEAVWRNTESRKLINDTKVSITLNLGNMYGKDIFK